jgi:hypothetical protein
MRVPNNEDAYTLETDIVAEDIQQLLTVAPVRELVLTKIPLVTVKLARRLAGLQVEQLWIRGDVTRRAIRHIIQIPGLQELNVSLNGPGQIANFGKAGRLAIFRADYCMTEDDLLQVAQCPALRELGAQSAKLSPAAIAAIASMPHLTTLDLEGTAFNDKMAKQIACSRTIASLALGATCMTGTGLVHLVEMKQLHSLDLWALNLRGTDLQLLLELPKLEYLSLGGNEHWRSPDPDAVTALLLACPSIKHVWLDGVHLQDAQRAALEARLDSLRVT